MIQPYGIIIEFRTVKGHNYAPSSKLQIHVHHAPNKNNLE